MLYVVQDDGGGACTIGAPWPGMNSFCRGDVVAELDANMGGSRGTTYMPAVPNLPSGAVTTFSGTAADTAAEITAAMQSPGWAQITLGADINAGFVSPHSGGVGATDVTIYLNNFTLSTFACTNAAGNAARIVVVGPGTIGNLNCTGVAGSVRDMIFHGLWFAPGFDGQAINFEGSADVERVSFTSTIARGLPAGGGSCGACLIGGADDVFIGNSNWEGCDNAVPNQDVWALRTSSDRVFVANSYLQAHYKHVARIAHGSQILYTTDSCVGQPCATTLVHEERANMAAAIGDPGVNLNLGAQIRTRWYVGDDDGVSITGWGPQGTVGFWYMAGTTICAANSALFDSADLAGADNGTTLLTNNLSYEGTPTNFSYADPVAGGCPVPAWPQRDADEITDGVTTIANSAIVNVGSDPQGTPP